MSHYGLDVKCANCGQYLWSVSPASSQKDLNEAMKEHVCDECKSKCPYPDCGCADGRLCVAGEAKK